MKLTLANNITDTLQSEHHFPLETAMAAIANYIEQIDNWHAQGMNHFTIARLISEAEDEKARQAEIAATNESLASRAQAQASSRTLLHNHYSFGTAYLQYDYPFGRRVRCLRKVWLELATQGAKKGEWRFCHATTIKSFNLMYTNLPDKTKLVNTIDKKPLTYVLDDMAYWNKPKASTYQQFMLLYQDAASRERRQDVGANQDDSDEVGAPFVFYAHLDIYNGPVSIYRFYDAWWQQMDSTERDNFVAAVRRLKSFTSDRTWAHELEQINRHELDQYLL